MNLRLPSLRGPQAASAPAVETTTIWARTVSDPELRPRRRLATLAVVLLVIASTTGPGSVRAGSSSRYQVFYNVVAHLQGPDKMCVGDDVQIDVSVQRFEIRTSDQQLVGGHPSLPGTTIVQSSSDRSVGGGFGVQQSNTGWNYDLPLTARFYFTAYKAGRTTLDFKVDDGPARGQHASLDITVEDCQFEIAVDARWSEIGGMNIIGIVPFTPLVPTASSSYEATATVDWIEMLTAGNCPRSETFTSLMEARATRVGPQVVVDLTFETWTHKFTGYENVGQGCKEWWHATDVRTPADVTFTVPLTGGSRVMPATLWDSIGLIGTLVGTGRYDIRRVHGS